MYDHNFVFIGEINKPCCKYPLICSIGILCLVCIILFVVLAAKNYIFCENADDVGSVVYSRSESVSLLKTVTDLTCYKPTVNAQLNGEALLSIYGALCKYLHLKEFHIHRKSLMYENVTRSMVLLSEDFSDNYFLKGKIELNINATFNRSEVYVCLFTDYKVFTDFTNSDKDWKMYTKNALCTHTSEKQFTATYDVTSPSYVFIAIAATTALETLQFGYNGTGYNYDIPSLSNLTELCFLQSGKPDGSFCSFSISDTGDNLCLLGSNEVNADGSYYYSTVTLTLPYIKRHVGAGIAFTVACIIIVMTISVISMVAVLANRLRTQKQ